MKKKSVLSLLVFGLAVSVFGCPFGHMTETVRAQDAKLQNSDCVKCHTTAPKDIEENGMAHKTSVTCQDCHEGHPPQALDIIPACSACHAGETHYDLDACLICHDNPHRPLEIQLAGDITAPCLTCHDGPGRQLEEFPSYHGELSCTNCHADTHPNVPNCTNCHGPHSDTMVEADCSRCHQAHKPLVVTYPDDTPSEDCGSCHDQLYKTLSGSKDMHTELLCANCHVSQHGNVPSCSNCHESHSSEMAFDQCTQCHRAHDPLPVSYGAVASAQCGACHSGTLETLSTSQTMHQGLACADCHMSEHGNIPNCSDCHAPHADDMVQSDCVSCHDAHKPAPVVYGEQIASKHCASCHGDAMSLLQASETLHSELSCAMCHQQQHKAIPACQDCHGKPHSEGMLKQFPDCGTCHGIAHDLMK